MRCVVYLVVAHFLDITIAALQQPMVVFVAENGRKTLKYNKRVEVMINGETTKYHEAAKAIEGQRIAAGSFNDVMDGGDAELALTAAKTPNVFGNISNSDNQREANLLATSQGAAGNDLSFTGNATAQRLGSEAQKAEKIAKDRKSFQDQAFQNLLTQIRALDRKIAWHEGEIARLTKQRNAIDDYMEKLRRGEKPEANADVDAAILAYEERYGVKVDRNDADQMAKVRGHTDGQISEHVRKKGGLEQQREGFKDKLRVIDPKRAAEEFDETYENDGRDPAEVMLSNAEDDAQTAAVNAQDFNAESEELAMAAADGTGDALFGASGGSSTGFQLGTKTPRTQGDLKGQFTSARDTQLAESREPNSPKPDGNKPFEFDQQMNS